MCLVKVTLPLLLIMVHCSGGATIPNIIQKNDVNTNTAKSLYKVVEFASYFFDKIMKEEEDEEEEKAVEKTENVTQYIKITSSIEIFININFLITIAISSNILNIIIANFIFIINTIIIY